MYLSSSLPVVWNENPGGANLMPQQLRISNHGSGVLLGLRRYRLPGT